MLKLRAPWLALALALAAANASAQTPSPASPAKKALVAKVLQLQQPGIETMARQLTEQPMQQMTPQINAALQRLPAEKRDALAKDIQADARRYSDEATAIVRERALKLAPATIGPILEEKFSEDELKQIVAMLESPVNRKFQQMGGDMQRALGEKLVAETRPLVEPKLRALEQSVVKRFEAQNAGGASAPKP